jgi:hypothetical protein
MAAGPFAYVTGMTVALSEEEAGLLKIPVPLGFEESWKQGDKLLRSKDGAMMVFHVTHPRPLGAFDRDSRAGLLAESVSHLRLNLGESCDGLDVRRFSLPSDWEVSFVEVNCQGRLSKSRNIAAVVAGPGLTYDVQAINVPLAKLADVLSYVRLAKQAKPRRILGATLGVPQNE